MSDVIRVFVGCSANHEDAESQAVLEYSIMKHATQPVEITWMQLSRDPGSFWYSDGQRGWRTEKWATPFSGFRWAIPEFCGFEGRAIYTDSDVIFMADIAELWNQTFQPGKSVMGKAKGSWRLCVSLWDCAAVRGIIPPLKFLRSSPGSHSMMSQKFRNAPFLQPFEGNWNCLDGEDYASLNDPSIKAIHYTNMANQPHLRYAIPRLAADGHLHWFDGKVEPHPRADLVALFDELLEEAEKTEYKTQNYLQSPEYGNYTKASMVHYRGARA